MVRAKQYLGRVYQLEDQPWTPVDQEGHRWEFHLDWAPDAEVSDCPEMYMILMASFDLHGSRPGDDKGLMGLLLLRLPTGAQTNKYCRVGVFRSDEFADQPRGSGIEFSRECADELVVIV